jgi:peroxiredoxin
MLALSVDWLTEAGRRRLPEVAAIDDGDEVAELSQCGDRFHGTDIIDFCRLLQSVFCVSIDFRMATLSNASRNEGLATAPTSTSAERIRSEFHVLINTEIKPFKATAFQKGKFIDVTDADLKGKGKWSVVFFYPADFTFVCPTELEDLADNYAEFQKLGVEIYSVSTDTHFSHKAWHDTSPAIKKIEYPMIGDPTLAPSRATSAS